MPEPLDLRLTALADELGGPLLALDTSGPQAAVCTVAWQPGEVREICLPAQALPSEVLAQTLAEELLRTGLAPASLVAIVVGLGPGSFTGLRVGLATAKGMALGAGVRLYGASSLALLAAACGEGVVATVLDARQGELYGALYRVSATGECEPLIADGIFAPQALVAALAAYGPELRMVGSGVAVLAPSLAKSCTILPPPTLRAGYALVHSADRLRRGEHADLMALAPRYLRKSP